MKNVFFLIMTLLISTRLFSDNLYQQTYLEFDDEMSPEKSYMCKATTSIKLLPGFSYKPKNGESMKLEIDRYSVLPPDEGVYGGVFQNDIGVVGALPGTFNVSNSGAAVYSINIETPPAIGSMKPNLSIVYNSQSGNGLVGWSWELAGLSSIIRTGQTEYHDGNVTSVDFVNDRYLMDGQRLMLVKGSCYGENKSEYKTEIDNMDKIVLYGNDKSPENFIVYKSDGTIWEYGITNDSRVETKNDDKIILKWMLSKVSDRNGNSMIFNYVKDVGHGEAYIDNIQYTSNEAAGLNPAMKISFVYENKQYDDITGYVCGNMIRNNKLLKSILIHNNYTGKKLFDYSLEYFDPGMYNGNYFIYHRLKSVRLAVGEDEINPTRIIWNAKKKHYNDNFQSYQLDKSVFSDNVPFVGDFNGDGYSDVMLVPYKIQDTYPNDVEGKVYLNNCNGGFHDAPSTSILLPKNIEWIYVVDMNGDGKDDVILYEFNYNAETEDDDIVTLHFYMSKDGSFVKDTSYSYKSNVALIPGKYMSDDEVGVVIVETYNKYRSRGKIEYVRFVDGKLIKTNVWNEGEINDEDTDYLALDINGDGINELMALYDDGYKLFEMSWDGHYGFEMYTYGSDVTKDSYLFPNDYNGDGKTDLLYYETTRQWRMTFSKGTGFATPNSCTNTNLLGSVTLNTKDRYKYSLKELQEPSATIRTGDFDGDGVADVGVFKDEAANHYLIVGFKPYLKSNNTCAFAFERRYYMPINYSHQTVQIGRFLPQENVSILSGLPRNPMSSQKAYITSLYPQSAYYSVERIIDGMGNVRGFSYDYLMQNDDRQERFYSCSNDITDNDIRRTSIPISALKSDTVFNINEVPLITKYEYYNAMIHAKGHGFLGFEKITTRRYMHGNVFEKKERGLEIHTLYSYCMALPLYERQYNGENQLLTDKSLIYKKYSCRSNDKIVIPLLNYSYETIYNPDRTGDFLKLNIVKNNYSSDVGHVDLYDHVVKCVSVNKGFTDKVGTNSVEDCPYIEKESVTYLNDDVNDWIVNKPMMICNYKQDSQGEKIGSAKIYVYDEDVPTRIVEETNIPNHQAYMSDPLTSVTKYEYDKFGNVIKQSMSSPSMNYEKVVRSEYGESYNYMYRTKFVDELGRETECNYDKDYGYLLSTTDYNDFVTFNEKDPLGINDVVTLPDGVVRARVMRWAGNNEHTPSGASYYTWEKSTGMAEVMVFYHKSGAELRRVSFDINGRAIYVDKKYDDYGNLIHESLPYYKGGDKYYMSHVYDRFNRLVEKRLPNGVTCSVSYDGNVVTTEYVSTNGDRKNTKETYNYMGWMVSVEDVGGNEIVYDYYSDGMLKSAMIAMNPNSKIIVTYDNLRNKKTLQDPNYGLVSYEYDAVGNIRKIVNPKGETIGYGYDMLGRMSSRNMSDPKNSKSVTTRWIYDDEKGKNGMLKKVVADNHTIDYLYDEYLRLLGKTETIRGNEYKTSYTYDPANRISSITYPSGLCVSKVFSNSGYEKAICDGDTLLWKVVETMADGSVTEYQLGNGVRTKISYNPHTSLTESILTFDEEREIQNLKYEYDDWGNVLSRMQLANRRTCEEFEYDDFDRLVSIKLNGRITSDMIYDYYGNIIGKTDDGVNVLYSTIYDGKRPNAIVRAKTDVDEMVVGFSRDMKYSMFDNLVSVIQGDDVMEMEYGSDNQRVYMKSVVDGKIMTKTYIGDCELIEENGSSVMLTYVSSPIGVFGVFAVDEKGEKTMNYIHTDNLGSWNIITDEKADVVQNVSFDAWGNVRNGLDWSSSADCELMYDRGFTGHEHLTDFGLINMNGRVYDPMMSMMLSPDNNIQIPQMSQNFNRYSYCLNNPLKYTDPTGEWVESVVMGVVGGAVNLAMNAKNVDNFGEGALAFGVGFVKGFLTKYTAGQSWFIQVGVNTLMSGVTSGVNQMVAVGDGSFKFSGDDWNSIKTAAHYGLGSALVNNFMFTYMTPPTEEDYGTSFFEMCYNQELAYGVTSIAAHGMGCWFSGQPFMSTMRFKDVGFDLKMLGIIAERLLASYIQGTDFADKAMEQRTQEIKDSVMEYVLSENPDHPDFKCYYQLKEICIEKSRVYVVGDVFALLPGEMIEIYPIPFLEEIVSFPFSYSLFKSLFFNDND